MYGPAPCVFASVLFAVVVVLRRRRRRRLRREGNTKDRSQYGFHSRDASTLERAHGAYCCSIVRVCVRVGLKLKPHWILVHGYLLPQKKTDRERFLFTSRTFTARLNSRVGRFPREVFSQIIFRWEDM